uniref:Uncharacterized protein n=1 Tax=Oryza punctata TaxID=4537 RepID=A0A0E0LGG1_ORYPU
MGKAPPSAPSSPPAMATAAAAARTASARFPMTFSSMSLSGVLSRRWRSLWCLLPELDFVSIADARAIRAALASHEAPPLRLILVSAVDATLDPSRNGSPSPRAASPDI